MPQATSGRPPPQRFAAHAEAHFEPAPHAHGLIGSFCLAQHVPHSSALVVAAQFVGVVVGAVLVVNGDAAFAVVAVVALADALALLDVDVDGAVLGSVALESSFLSLSAAGGASPQAMEAMPTAVKNPSVMTMCFIRRPPQTRGATAVPLF
jgi:hypothetical protein